jgi:hypothetical protein
VISIRAGRSVPVVTTPSVVSECHERFSGTGVGYHASRTLTYREKRHSR